MAAEVQVVVRIGEKNRAVLATLAPPGPPPPVAPPPLPPPPPVAPVTPEPDRHVPAGAWLLGGVGAAALGVFAYFGVAGKNDADNLRATCAPGCAPSRVDAVRAKLVTADVALGVGGHLARGGDVDRRAAGSRDRARPPWELVVDPDPDRRARRRGRSGSDRRPHSLRRSRMRWK